MANTPARTIRVNEELWQEAKATAESRGETVTDVITQALQRYVPSEPKRRVHIRMGTDGRWLVESITTASFDSRADARRWAGLMSDQDIPQ